MSIQDYNCFIQEGWTVEERIENDEKHQKAMKKAATLDDPKFST